MDEGVSAGRFEESGLIEDLPPKELFRGLFHLLFGREPDLSASGAFIPQIESGEMGPRAMVEWLVHSDEWSHAAAMTEFGPALHASRGAFIRSLPKARRILDIGGVALNSTAGALQVMGYPYPLEELVIVDLPSDERHELYRDESSRNSDGVTFRFHSMTDLSSYPDGGFDMVYSGESIEHVTRTEADSVLEQVYRVLRPGGIFALDTPNAALTRLQTSEYIDPDHKHEYTHAELSTMLLGHGFSLTRAVGIAYGGDCIEAWRFDGSVIARHRGLFDDIESSYLLGYVCRKPLRLSLKDRYKRLHWSHSNTRKAWLAADASSAESAVPDESS